MALGSTFNRLYQRIKNVIHAVQVLLIFVAAMITIAIFRKSGQSDTRITYYFVLCFISILFLIYQTAIPTFRILRKLANAYIHTILDTLLTILWLAAFIGEIVWAKDGTEAAKDSKSGDSTCQVFGYGPTDKCHLGQVTAYFGVVICILFALATALSIYGLFYFRKTGALPGYGASSTDPSTGKGDDLEFTGAAPEAYDVLQTQQEMHEQTQQPPQMQQTSGMHFNDTINLTIDSPPATPNTIQLRESEAHATLPPRPIYSKAPRSPLDADFDLPPIAHSDFLNPMIFQSQPYASRQHSYEGYRNDSADYSLPASPNPRRVAAELPALRVDTTRRGDSWTRVGGGGAPEVAFPAGDYGR